MCSGSSQLTAEKRVMVRLKRGEYDLRKCLRSYVKYLKDRARGSAPTAARGWPVNANAGPGFARLELADERRVQLGEL